MPKPKARQEKKEESWSAAILAGGSSSRMGQDKALLQDDTGRTWLERAVEVAMTKAKRILVLPGPSIRYTDLTLPAAVEFVPDAMDAIGPLGGIWTAIRKTQSTYLLCLTCDMPGLTKENVDELGKPLKEEWAVFASHTYFPCVIRLHSKVEKILLAQINSDRPSVGRFLLELKARPVSLSFKEELANLNYPEDYNVWKESIS